MGNGFASAVVNDRPFVGREAQLRRLEQALGDLLIGQGSLHLLAGEPGIGKTRLAEELAARAAGRGARVAWGRCWEHGGAPAYWPWVELLRALGAPPKSLSDGAGLLDWLPGLRDEAADLRGPDALGAAENRFQLFEGVRGLLDRAAAASPIVAVLDDLHWADVPSLLLLKFIARDLRRKALLLIGTYREADAKELPQVHRLLAEAAREGKPHVLSGLELAEVGRLASAVAQVQDANDVERLHRATGGNPFFIDEVLRLRGSSRAPWAVPMGVREVIRSRIAKLPEASQSLLGTASVIGRVFDVALVSEVSGVAAAAVVDAAHAALESGLLQAPSAARLAFSHDLLREVAYTDLAPSRRAALHGTVAQILDRSVARQSDPPWGELARHYLLAGDVERAITCACAAGREAMRRFAYEEAVDYFRDALQTCERSDASPARVIELMLALGEAQMLAAEITAGRQICMRAAELAKRMGAPVLLAQAALAYGAEPTYGFVDPDLVLLLQDALDAIGDADLGLRARLLARLAAAVLWSTAPEHHPIALGQDAISLARRTGDEDTLALVLESARSTFRGVDSLEDRVAIDRETLLLSQRRGLLRSSQLARRRLIYDLVEQGELAEANALIEIHARQAAELKRPRLEWELLLFRLMQAGLSGQFATARRRLQQAMDMHERLGELGGLGFDVKTLKWQHLRLGWSWGRRDELEALLECSWEPMESCCRALLLALLGRCDEARPELARALQQGLTGFVPHFLRTVLAETAAELNEPARASELYELLLPLQGRNVASFFACSAVQGSMDRWLGNVAALMQEWDAAESHYRSALESNRRIGALPDVAHTQFGHARMLLRRGRAEDSARAQGLLGEAIATFKSLGMEVYLERARELLGSDLRPPAPVLNGRPRLTLEGEYWTIAFNASVFRLKDSDGLRYLAYLLERPGEDVAALDLLALRRGGGAPGLDDGSDAGPVLDEEAKRAYRRRLENLNDMLEEAMAFNDLGRAERAQAEIDFLTQELSRAVGLAGRDRKVGSNAERARVNVSTRIHKAIKKIAECDAALGRHLQATIRTGNLCAFVPLA